MPITILLLLISAIESNNGTNLNHPVIQDPSSIHYKTAAISEYAVMPHTLEALGTKDPEIAATRLIERLVRKGGGGPNASICVFEVFIKWQMGPNHKITDRDIKRSNIRKNRAIIEMRRIGLTPAQYVAWVVNACPDKRLL